MFDSLVNTLVLPLAILGAGGLIGTLVKIGVEKAKETPNPYDDVVARVALDLLKAADDELEGTQYEELADKALEIVGEVDDVKKKKALESVFEPLIKK